MVLPRFNGDGNPESWIFRAELYFTYIGFNENDWLPLPSFYLDGEALAWFSSLFCNKLFLDWKHFKGKFVQRFRQQTNNDVVRRLANSLHVHFDCTNSVPIVSQSVVLPHSNFPASSALDFTYDIRGNSKVDQVSTPFFIVEAKVFDKIYHTTVSSEINVLNIIDHEGEKFATTIAKVGEDNFSEDVSLQTKMPTAVLVDTKESNTEGEENPRDNVVLFVKCPKWDTSDSLGYNLPSFLSSNLTGCASEEKIQKVIRLIISIFGLAYKARLPWPYIDFDPGPYIFVIDSTFGDIKSMANGVVTVLFNCPDTGYDDFSCPSIDIEPLHTISNVCELLDAAAKRCTGYTAQLCERACAGGVEIDIQSYGAFSTSYSTLVFSRGYVTLLDWIKKLGSRFFSSLPYSTPILKSEDGDIGEAIDKSMITTLEWKVEYYDDVVLKISTLVISVYAPKCFDDLLTSAGTWSSAEYEFSSSSKMLYNCKNCPCQEVGEAAEYFTNQE
ncbi:hypothetical protein MTR67_027239 [Solanum verrucosum]|uniref:Uncharacterized protein n=1 Tax=Solanum verrucosum TaxID=315347 RepID=A0AAF0R0C8_SOLVR|nr:hypothetical protein MTR67_027239 [Solanum verrucosum]